MYLYQLMYSTANASSHNSLLNNEGETHDQNRARTAKRFHLDYKSYCKICHNVTLRIHEMDEGQGRTSSLKSTVVKYD